MQNGYLLYLAAEEQHASQPETCLPTGDFQKNQQTYHQLHLCSNDEEKNLSCLCGSYKL